MRDKALTRVFVRNLELSARIGVHRHEQDRDQPIRINLELVVDSRAEEDRLESVVDYEAVANRVRAIVAESHIKLAETLAERIATACLEDARVVLARVRVEKLHAVTNAESAGVEIERSRS